MEPAPWRRVAFLVILRSWLIAFSEVVSACRRRPATALERRFGCRPRDVRDRAVRACQAWPRLSPVPHPDGLGTGRAGPERQADRVSDQVGGID